MEVDSRRYLESARKLSLERELRASQQEKESQQPIDSALDTSFHPSMPDVVLTPESSRVGSQTPAELEKEIADLTKKKFEQTAILSYLYLPECKQKKWAIWETCLFGAQSVSALLNFASAFGSNSAAHISLGFFWTAVAAFTYFRLTHPNAAPEIEKANAISKGLRKSAGSSEASFNELLWAKTKEMEKELEAITATLREKEILKGTIDSLHTRLDQLSEGD